MGPAALPPRRFRAIYKWAATAGCGLHRVIALGFRGVQERISTIINKSTLSWWQQLLCPSGTGSRQLNSLINTTAIVHCALGVALYWQGKKRILIAYSSLPNLCDKLLIKPLKVLFSPSLCVSRMSSLPVAIKLDGVNFHLVTQKHRLSHCYKWKVSKNKDFFNCI